MAFTEQEIREIVLERNPEDNDATISNTTDRVLTMIEDAVMRIIEEEA